LRFLSSYDSITELGSVSALDDTGTILSFDSILDDILDAILGAVGVETTETEEVAVGDAGPDAGVGRGADTVLDADAGIIAIVKSLNISFASNCEIVGRALPSRFNILLIKDFMLSGMTEFSGNTTFASRTRRFISIGDSLLKGNVPDTIE
jgi:hypothetical protein